METLEILSDYELEPHRRTGNKPMPTLLHGVIQANLTFELKTHYHHQYLFASEVTLDTSPRASAPDLLAYPRRELDFENDPPKRTDAPLLAVEIQSASQTVDEMVDKVVVYFAFGVRSCWIVQPRLRAVLVFDRPDHYHFFHYDDLLRDQVLNLELPLTNLFG